MRLWKHFRLAASLLIGLAAAGSGLLATLPAVAQSAIDVGRDRPNVNWKPPTAGAIAASVDLTTALGLPACANGSVLSYDPTRFNGRGWGCVNSVTNAAQLGGRDLDWVRGHATGGTVDRAATAGDADTLGGRGQAWIRDNATGGTVDRAATAGDADTLGGRNQAWIRDNATGGTVDRAATAGDADTLGGRSQAWIRDNATGGSVDTATNATNAANVVLTGASGGQWCRVNNQGRLVCDRTDPTSTEQGGSVVYATRLFYTDQDVYNNDVRKGIIHKYGTLTQDQWDRCRIENESPSGENNSDSCGGFACWGKLGVQMHLVQLSAVRNKNNGGFHIGWNCLSS